jgi:hypothetical protein
MECVLYEMCSSDAGELWADEGSITVKGWRSNHLGEGGPVTIFTGLSSHVYYVLWSLFLCILCSLVSLPMYTMLYGLSPYAYFVCWSMYLIFSGLSPYMYEAFTVM